MQLRKLQAIAYIFSYLIHFYSVPDCSMKTIHPIGAVSHSFYSKVYCGTVKKKEITGLKFDSQSFLQQNSTPKEAFPI